MGYKGVTWECRHHHVTHLDHGWVNCRSKFKAALLEHEHPGVVYTSTWESEQEMATCCKHANTLRTTPKVHMHCENEGSRCEEHEWDIFVRVNMCKQESAWLATCSS